MKVSKEVKRGHGGSLVIEETMMSVLSDIVWKKIIRFDEKKDKSVNNRKK